MAVTLTKPTIKDRQRWYLWKQEKPIEEIAARDRVGEDTIRKSIDAVEIYRMSGAYEEVDISWNHMALRLVEDQESVLRSAMVAESWRTMKDGTEIPIPDHATRLKAIEVVKDLAVVSRPKAPMNQVNVQTNVANGTHGSNGGGLSFESRLREIRERRGMGQLGSGQPLLIESAPEQTQAEKVAAELDDIGIDLDEDDLRDLEGEEEDDETTEEEPGSE